MQHHTDPALQRRGTRTREGVSGAPDSASARTSDGAADAAVARGKREKSGTDTGRVTGTRAVSEGPSTRESQDEHSVLLSLGFPRAAIRAKLRDDTGAVTAEYALIIMAGVAFAGVLIVIMRSDEVRAMLLSLVQNALSSAG